MPTLLQRAESHVKPTKRTAYVPVTNEEIELYIAYLQEIVTFGQVTFALGRSYTYAANWTRRCANWLYLTQVIRLHRASGTIAWKPPEQYKLERERVYA